MTRYRKIYKQFLAALCLAAGLVSTGRAFQSNDTALTVTSDGSYSDTAQAVAYATGKGKPGWVVTVGAPGGSYTWTNQLTINATNAITLQGASTNNRPTIMFAGPTHSGIYASATGGFATIKDLVFNVATNGPWADVIAIDGTGVCFRVTDCKFLNSSTGAKTGTPYGLQVGSINSVHATGPYGLVDHCQFYFPGGRVYNYVNVFANGDVDGYCWTQPMSWGTTNSVVIESCAFSQPNSAPMSGVAEAMGGARMTIRYNSITNVPQSSHGRNSGSGQSTLQVECYGNNWVLNDPTYTMPYLFLQRGGTSVIFSNTVTSTGYWNLASSCQFWVECAATSQWQSEHCTNELFYPQNYPDQEQVGQGVVNGKSGSVPTYIWGNHFPATYWGDFVLGRDGGDAPFIQQGRDIFTNSVMPGYKPLVFPHPLDVLAGGTSGTIATNSGPLKPPTNLQVSANK